MHGNSIFNLCMFLEVFFYIPLEEEINLLSVLNRGNQSKAVFVNAEN